MNYGRHRLRYIDYSKELLFAALEQSRGIQLFIFQVRERVAAVNYLR